jgi:predicted dithiol-disulfide oxidoreductase (DUF899 family)
MRPAAPPLVPPAVVPREEWLSARRDLLIQEKQHMRRGDELAAARRALPWLRVDRPYLFDTPDGSRTLPDLFGCCRQLIVHHLMFHPGWEAACDGCSFQAEHIDGPRPHLEHNDVAIVAVSRAPLAKIEAYRRRMGWTFRWVSSHGSAFNFDFHVSFTEADVERGRIDYNFGTITDDPRYFSEELPGVSVFAKDPDGNVFHTYSTYARGLDALLGAHAYFDLTPNGRRLIDAPGSLQRHDEYDRPARPREIDCCEPGRAGPGATSGN